MTLTFRCWGHSRHNAELKVPHQAQEGLLPPCPTPWERQTDSPQSGGRKDRGRTGGEESWLLWMVHLWPQVIPCMWGEWGTSWPWPLAELRSWPVNWGGMWPEPWLPWLTRCRSWVLPLTPEPSLRTGRLPGGHTWPPPTCSGAEPCRYPEPLRGDHEGHQPAQRGLPGALGCVLEAASGPPPSRRNPWPGFTLGEAVPCPQDAAQTPRPLGPLLPTGLTTGQGPRGVLPSLRSAR